MMNHNQRIHLLNTIKTEALSVTDGPNTLPFGRKSHLLIDMSVIGSKISNARCMAELLDSHTPHDANMVICGVGESGIAPARDLATRIGADFGYVTSESHTVKGLDVKDRKLFFVQDVMTTGDTLIQCMETAADQGAKIAGGIAILDRSFGAAYAAYNLQRKRHPRLYTYIGCLRELFKLEELLTPEQLAQEKRYHDAWMVEQKQSEYV